MITHTLCKIMSLDIWEHYSLMFTQEQQQQNTKKFIAKNILQQKHSFQL